MDNATLSDRLNDGRFMGCQTGGVSCLEKYSGWNRIMPFSSATR
ncbi:hypothetical protein MGSAQ_001101 [marine sediment metagenome]|uniref:Uncharacterized protein n=1 Tax=marine sediment metagenome TaxID=412755 RepID=A0A1B6NVP3_9ZZZZ